MLYCRYYFEEEDIWFEIIDSDSGNDDDGKQVLWDDHIVWDDGIFNGPPDRKGIEYLSEEIDKLEAIETLTDEEKRHVSMNEWSTIIQYKETVVRDLHLAMEEAEKLLELSGNNGSGDLPVDKTMSLDEL